MNGSKRLYEEYAEEQHEEHIQDLLFMQASEYDMERELLGNMRRPEKRLFANKSRFKNRRNLHRFAKRYNNKEKLPF